ncbi:hypothetical protein GCQ56_05150 [Marinifilum sp. N1E240]|uniref:hypothetical protein n=1 Tax=Marinifilum sp. N1E240 TaxID=2608082 RepID=UPI00128BB91F|nr:hypothetical protein [Marinifilum sp. N1E240]MPQ46390.1 hypothetical protein [Marinifilum sp. N1E240]
MSKFLKIVILNCWFLIFSGTMLYASQTNTASDTLILDKGQVKTYKKDISKDRIKEYRQLKDFNYDLSEPESVNIFERIQLMVQRWLAFISKSLGVIWYLRYILIGGLILFLIFIIVKSNSSGLFKPHQKIIPIQFTDNMNPETVNWEEEIAKALKNKEYRLAVRYQFLASLKTLSKLDFIIWKSEKTNYDYILEIKDTNIKTEFSELSALYEAIWYGNFPIVQEDYTSIGNDFERFNSMFNTNRK